MNEQIDQDAPRYAPATEASATLSTLLREYDRAYEVALAAQKRLLAWVGQFVDVKVGDIVLQSRRHGKTTGFVPSFDMRGTFTGWKGNTPRMLVQEVHVKSSGLLQHFPGMTVILRGVPLKNDGTPFKSCSCQVEIDVFQQAMDSAHAAEGGYRGFAHDVTTRYVDEKLTAGDAGGVEQK